MACAQISIGVRSFSSFYMPTLNYLGFNKQSSEFAPDQSLHYRVYRDNLYTFEFELIDVWSIFIKLESIFFIALTSPRKWQSQSILYSQILILTDVCEFQKNVTYSEVNFQKCKDYRGTPCTIVVWNNWKFIVSYLVTGNRNVTRNEGYGKVLPGYVPFT